MLMSLKHMIYEQSSKQQKWEWKSTYTEWAEYNPQGHENIEIYWRVELLAFPQF